MRRASKGGYSRGKIAKNTSTNQIVLVHGPPPRADSEAATEGGITAAPNCRLLLRPATPPLRPARPIPTRAATVPHGASPPHSSRPRWPRALFRMKVPMSSLKLNSGLCTNHATTHSHRLKLADVHQGPSTAPCYATPPRSPHGRLLRPRAKPLA